MVRLRDVSGRRDPDVLARAFRAAATPVSETEDGPTVSFVTPPGVEPQSFILSYLVKKPDFVDPIQAYLAKILPGQAPETRRNSERLIRYFFEFLPTYERLFEVDILDFTDFSDRLIDGYIRWLNGDTYLQSPLQVSDDTKIIRFRAIRNLWDWLANTSKWSEGLPTIIFGDAPWKGSTPNGSNHTSLTPLEIAVLRRACITEVSASMERLRFGRYAISLKRDYDLESRSVKPFRTFEDCIAAYHRAIGIAVSYTDFISRFIGLTRALKPNYHSTTDIAGHIFLSTRTLVPWLLLIALDTGYNTSSLLGINWSNIEEHPLFPDRITINPFKSRARAIQPRSFAISDPDPYSVTNLLAFLSEQAVIIRELLPDGHKDRVFVSWRSTGSPPRSLIGPNRSIDSALYKNIAEFIIDNNLTHLTISDIRMTVSELVDFMSNGDLRSRATILGNRSQKTTDNHYRNADMGSRRVDRLAHAMRVRQQYIDSRGKIKRYSTSGLSHGATPGFLCLDLFSSPVAGQKEGRPCSAYCKCPDCPLAVCDDKNPYEIARLLQVMEALEAAKTALSTERWLMEWLPQRNALDEWLDLPMKLIDAAKKLKLPPIPSIE